MLPLRYPWLWLSLGWAAVAMAIVLSLAPIDRLPQPPNVSDKTEHFVAYLLLSLWFAGIYPRSRYWIVALGLCAMGMLIELAQGAMQFGRQADILDVLANSTGIAVGVLLCWLWLGGWAQRMETWIETLRGKAVARKS